MNLCKKKHCCFDSLKEPPCCNDSIESYPKMQYSEEKKTKNNKTTKTKTKTKDKHTKKQKQKQKQKPNQNYIRNKSQTYYHFDVILLFVFILITRSDGSGLKEGVKRIIHLLLSIQRLGSNRFRQNTYIIHYWVFSFHFKRQGSLLRKTC